MKRRHVLLTLTPLLDLMLVVIFAQYIDLQEVTLAQVQQEQLRRTLAEQAEQEKSQTAQSAFEELRRQNDLLTNLRAEKDALLEDNARLKARLEASDAEYRRQLEEERRETAEQIERIAQTVREVLNVPLDVLTATLKDAPASEVRAVTANLAKLQQASSANIVRYLHEVAEFRKRWDIWEVHIHADGSCRMTMNQRPVEARLLTTTREGFFQQLETVLKDAAEPKSFVLVVVSYADATLQARENAMQGLNLAREKFRNYWSSEKQIYVSRLGFIAERHRPGNP